MKVLHVIPSLSAVHGGPSRAIVMMEQTLARQFIQVETATTNDEGKYQRNNIPCNISQSENGVIRWYFNKTCDNYKVSVDFHTWIQQHITDYDLLHIHALFSFTSNIAAIIAKRKGVPYIIRPLGTLANYGITQRRPWLKRLSLTMIEAPLLRHAAAVHFTSEVEKQEAESLGISMNSVVIPLGIEEFSRQANRNLIIEQYPQLQNKTIILFLSRLDPKKNIEGLLRAISICKNTLQDICLIIVGDGNPDYVQSLKSLSSSLDLDQYVIWTGQLEGELKTSAFACADIFTLPSFSENFGIAVAEALMAGLPCVVGKGVAISKQIEDSDAGIVTNPTPESIAEGLSKLINNKAQRQKLAINARNLAHQEFSVDTMGNRLVALYQNILSKNSHKSC
jgi:glycosyltransferase involved in cell wall biosynthesis